MKKMSGGLALLTGALMFFGLASTAQAGVITWDFQFSDTNQHSKTVNSTNGLLGLDVSAWYNTDNFATAGIATLIRQNGAGMGVAGLCGTQINNTCGSPYAEWIAVAMPANGWSDLVLGLRAINSSEQFIMFGFGAPDASAGPAAFLGQFQGGDQFVDFYNIPSSATNFAYLLIGVTHLQASSGFRIASISANVPEPAAIALIGFGLVGLGLARRRRQTA